MAKLSKEEIIGEVLMFAAKQVAKRAAKSYIDNRMEVSDELRDKLVSEIGHATNDAMRGTDTTQVDALSDEEIELVTDQLAQNLRNDAADLWRNASLAAKSEYSARLGNAAYVRPTTNNYDYMRSGATANALKDASALGINVPRTGLNTLGSPTQQPINTEANRIFSGLSENGDEATNNRSANNAPQRRARPEKSMASSIYTDPDVGTAASDIQSQPTQSVNRDAAEGANDAKQPQAQPAQVMTPEQQLADLEAETDPNKKATMVSDSVGFNAPNLPGSNFMHRRKTVQQMQNAYEKKNGSGGLTQKVLTKIGGKLLFDKAEQVGEKLQHNIKTGRFDSFLVALLLAVIKDVCDFLFDAESVGLIGTLLSIFVGVILYAVLFNQGTWFKRWIIRRYFWGMIATQLAEFIPIADFFPWYTISILIMEYNNAREIAKFKLAEQHIKREIRKLKKMLARGQEIKPRTLRHIQKEVDRLYAIAHS